MVEKMKIDLPFDQIFWKIEIGDFCIVHMKSTMEPFIYDQDLKVLYYMPDGYMDYDKKHYYRNIA